MKEKLNYKTLEEVPLIDAEVQSDEISKFTHITSRVI